MTNANVAAEQSFTGDTASVAAARQFLRDQLSSWGQQAVEWAAELAVSELASNSVLHANTEFTVSLRVLPDGAIRVEVIDGVRRRPRQRDYGTDATTGRGISLVARLARAWGVEPLPAGKVVWCELVGDPADAGLASGNGQVAGRADTGLPPPVDGGARAAGVTAAA
ncbi:MAG: hypothetical protein QOG49_512 [Frankiaceae bacterium]|nr:hypothetical protein [Frankiaceae bacterium]